MGSEQVQMREAAARKHGCGKHETEACKQAHRSLTVTLLKRSLDQEAVDRPESLTAKLLKGLAMVPISSLSPPA